MDPKADLRKRLVAFYAKYNPVRLQSIDEIVESWHDDEQSLFDALREKYHLDHDFQPKKVLSPAPQSQPAMHSLETLCHQMEQSLNALFISQESHHDEEATTTFRDSAAAFSELTLAIVSGINQRERELAEVREKHDIETSVLAAQAQVIKPIPAPRPDPLVESASTKINAANFSDDKADGPQVHDVMPLDVDAIADKVISNVIRTKCRDGDIINIHPGIYRDNILISGLRVQLRATGDAKDRPVVFISADTNVPIIQIGSKGLVSLHGLEFTSSSDKSAASVPLIAIDRGSAVQAEGCSFVGGGGGVMIGDSESWLQMTSCTFRECVFAGVYAKGGAKVALRKCKSSLCEVFVRVRDAMAEIEDSEICASTSDGLTCHGNCRATVKRCLFADNKENGSMLSPSSVVTFHGCDFSRNGQYGIYVPSGAEYATESCVFTANTMGSYNRPPPVATQLNVAMGKGR